VHSLALLEAQAGSEIKNIVIPTDELFRADTVQRDAPPATREALRDKQALSSGHARMEDRASLLLTGMAAEICSEIRGTTTDIPRGEGTYIGSALRVLKAKQVAKAGASLAKRSGSKWNRWVEQLLATFVVGTFVVLALESEARVLNAPPRRIILGKTACHLQ
jgi:hypothetical protein